MQKNNLFHFDRIKKTIRVALMITSCSLLFAGCSLGMSESGADVNIGIEKSDYLDLSVLERTTEELSERVYKTITLEYGTFENVVSDRARIFDPVTYVEKVSFDSGEMTFVEYLVNDLEYVEKGQAIAEVSMSTDAIRILEAKIDYERLCEKYESAQATRLESLEGRDEIFWKLKTKEEQDIKNIQWRIEDKRWEQTEASYRSRIDSAQKNIKELEKNAKTTKIYAENSGYVYEFEDLENGDVLKNGQSILTLVPDNMVYICVNDPDKKYTFEKEFTVKATLGRSINLEFKAICINPSLRSVFLEVNPGLAYFAVDAQLWRGMQRTTIVVSGVANRVENVLLIPAGLVKEVSGVTYVTVLNEDGSICDVPFLAGGNNREYYWVFSGLSEGMKIVVE